MFVTTRVTKTIIQGSGNAEQQSKHDNIAITQSTALSISKGSLTTA